MRGVQVGRVVTVTSANDAATLQLDINPDQLTYIPANVQARISASSLFGAKFVDLVPPNDPSPKRLTGGALLTSQNVAVEVNTVFENLVNLIKQIDPYKLNAVLSALAEGVGGRGEQIGQSITDTNEVLTALIPRTETVRADVQSLAAVSDTQPHRHRRGPEHHQRHRHRQSQSAGQPAGRHRGPVPQRHQPHRP
jgi:phospholipid/cholesterol/gamma-HCH transport system substrate-binding protein